MITRNYKIGFIVLTILFAIANTVDAQNSAIEEKIKSRAAHKVGLLGEYIGTIADKSQGDLRTRLHFCDKALSLFIGKGGPYEEDGVERKGVVMEVTSVNRKNADGSPYVNRRLMKNYFNGLANLRYDAVSIETTDVADIKVSNLHRVADNLFVCTCFFEQAFTGYKDGRPVYKDITRKAVKCYVIQDEIEPELIEEGGDRYEYLVLLGDVRAIDTVRVK